MHPMRGTFAKLGKARHNSDTDKTDNDGSYPRFYEKIRFFHEIRVQIITIPLELYDSYGIQKTILDQHPPSR